MPRKKRVWFPNVFYNVSSHGIRHDKLFITESDYIMFFNILRQVHEDTPFEVSAYCLMSNHFHLQIRFPHCPISYVMGQLNKRYAHYFNKKYRFSGHVFDKRFYSSPINDLRGLLNVSSYFHNNPVKAKLSKNAQQYRWSSIHYFSPDYSKTLPPYMNISPILDIFPGPITAKKQQYLSWVENALIDDETEQRH
ncbi:REP element-mobilizing transposase RayT [Evansella caseinilytica]|uniref:REP element-mobilizing transposase RayT n=1 Tax=Evansella caseinilytica TaxID=1503961 RepID=A0A1H3U029_9BACI|nr:transposase [Evansella caseinilytica]SDZ55708.1 REP element-mobilizing transposase RayT [Evansella caseinilytica]